MKKLFEKFTCCAFVFFLVLSQAPTIAIANDLPLQVSLVSPKSGEVVNSKLPFTITLAITGGNSLRANTCFTYPNQDQSRAITGIGFGAQFVDAQNIGSALSWGINNNDGKSTGGGLLAWDLKPTANGVECSIRVNTFNQKAVSRFADFSKTISDLDSEWFGTVRGEPGPAKILDIAWSVNGQINHKKFETTDNGLPAVTLIGLTRAQVIDYESSFQVKVITPSQFKPAQIYAGHTNTWGNSRIQCKTVSEIVPTVKSDGTTEYISNCKIALNPEINLPAIEIFGSARFTDIYDSEISFRSEDVLVNLGKQGLSKCLNSLDSLGYSYDSLQRIFYENSNKFPYITTATQGNQILQALKPASQNLVTLGEDLAKIQNDIEECKRRAVDQKNNISALTIKIENLRKNVTTFVNSPALQAKAVAAAKSAAAALAKYQYNLGFNFVSKLSSTQLVNYSFLNFIQPGKKSLTTSYAKEWCQKLPMIVPGLVNQVGFPANSSYVSGCTQAALKIRIK